MKQLFQRCSILALLLAGSAGVGAQTWVGNAPSPRWSEAANWFPVASPRKDGTMDVSFLSGVHLSPQVDAPWAVRSINFFGSTVGFTIEGEELRIGAGGLLNNSDRLQSLLTPVVLLESQIWSANAGPVNVGGGVLTAGHLLTLGGGFPFSIQGSVAGSGGIIKRGSSVLSLLASNSFSGGLKVESGALVVGDDRALGMGVFHLGNATVLGTQGRRVLANPTLMDTADDPTFTGQSDLVFSGRIILGGNRTLRVMGPGRLEFSGEVTPLRDGSSLSKLGEGTLVLSGSNPVALVEPLRVGLGTLLLNKTAGVSAMGGNLDIGGDDGAAASAVVRLGSDHQIPDGSRVLVWQTGWLDLDGHDESATLVLGGGRVTTGAGTLTLAADLSSTLSGTVSLVSGRLNLGTVERVFNIVDSIPGIDVSIDAAISLGSIVKTGSGGLRLGGRNSFAGGFYLEHGLLQLGHDEAAGTGPIHLVNSGTAVGAVGGPRRVMNPVVWNGALTLTGDDPLEFAGSGVLAGDLALDVIGSGRKILSGGIDERISRRALVKRGVGELVLSGANQFKGGIRAEQGWMTLAHPGAAGGAALDLQGAGLRLGASSGPVVVSSLTMTPGTELEFSLGSPGGAPLLDVQGPLLLNGRLVVQALQGFGPGLYPLLHYSGPLAAGIVLKAGSLPAGYEYSLLLTPPGQVVLSVSEQQNPPVAVLLLAPRIGALGMEFSFVSQAGRVHSVEVNGSLSPSGWVFLRSIPGDGNVVVFDDIHATESSRFYRVLTE